MTREEMIDALVERDIVIIERDLAEGDTWLLNCMLRGNGWVTYASMTDAQIATEYNDGEPKL